MIKICISITLLKKVILRPLLVPCQLKRFPFDNPSEYLNCILLISVVLAKSEWCHWDKPAKYIVGMWGPKERLDRCGLFSPARPPTFPEVEGCHLHGRFLQLWYRFDPYITACHPKTEWEEARVWKNGNWNPLVFIPDSLQIISKPPRTAAILHRSHTYRGN